MPPTLRTSSRAVASLVAVLLLGGCTPRGTARPASLDRALDARLAHDDRAVVHFLNRITFCARPSDVEAVHREGVAAFLDRQLHPERIDDSATEARLASFETLQLSSKAIAEQYYQPAQDARRRRQIAGATPGMTQASLTPGADQELFRRERLVLLELSEQKLLRAVYSERQLQEQLVDFWFNHFNVFAGKGADRELLTAYERDTIRPHVFGKFRDLLGATAESPAMLFYLDNWLSAARNDRTGLRTRAAAARQPPKPGAQRTRAPGLNENYARELMELHTLGVDGGYTQRDVVEVARCLTGWTIAQPRDGGGFRFDERRHDPERKVVLGHVIKAGGGKSDGDEVLDILARDPHTARFIATKLVRRFVTDDPPEALVDRVARRFRETDGDLRELYRAIFASPEFWAPAAYDAKTRTPFEFVAGALRSTNAQVDDAAGLVQAIRALGMPLYFCQPPSGYAEDDARAWMTTGALLGRMNFALALADNRVPGVRLNGGLRPDPRDSMKLALAIGSPGFQKR